MAIDVYKDWLGIADTDRPLNYYQLLKLKLFEDNTILIRKQYRTLNAHVRKYASGGFIDESQVLLNELAQAMLCLTDAERKTEYDVSIGRKDGSMRLRKSFEDILVAGKICTPEQVKKAKTYADAVGLDVYQAALQHKLAAPETIMLAYAESIGLPFISLDDIGVDEEYAPQIPPLMARQHSFVPVMVTDGKLILASPSPVNPDVEQELRMLFDMPVRSAICVPTQVNDAIAKYYPKDAKQFVARDGGTAKSAADTAADAIENASGTVKQKPKKEAKAKPVREPSAPASEEAIKNRNLGTIIAFNLSVMGTVGTMYYGLGMGVRNPNQLFVVIPAGLLVGGIVAGLTFFFLSKK
ncbi:MAG: hypothetical protein FWC50_03920 [Planctomycetaceae bacterium]|nr:hypothetical protein [Planctomycetaceae bacterium]